MSNFSGKANLTEGPVRGHLVRMTIPMLWGILAMISVQLVDTFYISRLGIKPLAAIGFTFPVTMTVFSLIIGMGIAASSILSRRAGANAHHDIVFIASHAILLSVILGAVMAGTGIILLKPLFHLMGAGDDLMPFISAYMTIWFAGCIIMPLPLVGNSSMRALGDTVTPAFIMIGLSALNAGLAAIMIFGFCGFPRLGIQGAALATILSYMAAAIASLSVLYFKKKMIFQGSLHLEKFSESARHLLSIAIPVSIASIIQPVAQGAVTAILAGYASEKAVAAFGVATRIEALAFVIIIALATGMSPIIGQNWGADKYGRVRETLKLAMVFSTLWSLLIALLMGALAQPLAKIFSDDPEIIHYCVLYFCIVPISYAAGNLVMGWSSAFNAMGEPKKALMMIVVRLIILQVPMALLCGRLFGAAGVFASISAVNIVTGLYFHLRHWSDIMRLPPEIDVAAT
jgi:putative MATE family efflux protein